MDNVEIKFHSWRNKCNPSGNKEFAKISVDECLGDNDEFIMNEIAISGYSVWSEVEFMVSLDIETAIKFSKELRKQINKAKEGGHNG